MAVFQGRTLNIFIILLCLPFLLPVPLPLLSTPFGVLIALTGLSLSAHAAPDPIKAFCIDFNWGDHGAAEPGLFAQADPEEHVRWYQDLGGNVIQTFCVSYNGYA